jgi:microcystin-dependent protein
MADEPFLGEVRIFSFNFAPSGWALCNGGLMPVNQNQALFSLLGTTFGGNGSTNFALPDLRDRIPMHFGPGNAFNLGQRGGEAAHTLSVAELPTHTHVFNGTLDAGSANDAQGGVLATATVNAYNDPLGLAAIDPTTVTAVGGSQPHLNLSPFLGLQFCIALTGVFPTRS